MDDKKKQSIGSGFLILSAAGIAVKLVSLIFVPVIRHFLNGDEGYSVYSSAYSVYAFIYVLTTAGLPVAISKIVTELVATKHSKEAQKAFDVAKKALIGIGLLFSLTMAVLAKPLASFMKNEESWMGILCIAPTVFICALLSAYRGYFQGRKNMIPTASSQVAEQIVHVVVSVGLVILLKSKGIVWAVAGATVGTAAGALVAFLMVYISYRKTMPSVNETIENENIIRKSEGIEPVGMQEILRKLVYYSMPITFSSAVQYGGDLIDNKTIKECLLGAGYVEKTAKGMHGAFMSMRQLINVPVALVTALCVSVLPAIASAYAVKDRAKVSERANYGFGLCYKVSIPIIAAMMAFSKPIYTLLGYSVQNHYLLMITAPSVLLLGTMHLQSSVLQGVNRMFTSSGFLCICVILKTLLNYILVSIPSVNIYGAVIATYVSYLVPVILNHRVLSKREALKIRLFRLAVKPLIASAVMVAVSLPFYLLIHYLLGMFVGGYGLTLVSFVPTAVIGVFVYFVAMRKMHEMTNEQLDEISPKVTKILRKFKLDRI